MSEFNPADQQILLARQPIYDRSLQVFAYELLHRSSDPDNSSILDGNEASSQVLLDTFGDRGIANITQDKPAFINFTQHLIINPPPLEPDQLIIEVLEDVEPTTNLIAGLRRLKDMGFRIALDDFVHRDDLSPLVEMADIIKLDVMDLGYNGMLREVEKLQRFDGKLLAEKIEDWGTYNQCKELGFDYFQGFFLARPQLVHGKRNLIGGHLLPELLAQLSNPEASPPAIANAISFDPIISYQLIRLVNSALYKPVRPIEALPEVITYLGVERIRGWLLILALSRSTAKPRELLQFALIRAKMCELLAAAAELDSPPRYFTLGVLSTMDAFLDKTLADALEGMHITQEIELALIDGKGPMGVILRATLAFERADLDAAPWQALASLGCTANMVERAYLDSLAWSASSMSSVTTTG